MGYLSDINKQFFGGSDSKSTSESTSGFSLLPQEIQDAFKQYASKTTDIMPNIGESFTPLAQTADEDNAFSAIRGGFAPTQSSIGSDIGMQMNPFDDSVINDINRQAGGEFSVLKGVLDEGGAFGSNREMLGANDIDLSRLNQIGRFKQDQYNSALDNALTTMPNARSQDAQNLLGIGDRERALDASNKQSGIQGLLAIGQAMGVLPASGGTISSSYSNSSQRNGAAEGIAGIAKSMAGGGGGGK